MNFQKLILTTATIILIIVLVVIGVTISKSSQDMSWPPIVGSCPDYWVDMSGACFNAHSLGRCNIPSKDDKNMMVFNQSPFTGENGDCAKYNWATACKVTWDGITSGVQNPCDTTTTP